MFYYILTEDDSVIYIKHMTDFFFFPYSFSSENLLSTCFLMQSSSYCQHLPLPRWTEKGRGDHPVSTPFSDAKEKTKTTSSPNLTVFSIPFNHLLPNLIWLKVYGHKLSDYPVCTLCQEFPLSFLSQCIHRLWVLHRWFAFPLQMSFDACWSIYTIILVFLSSV